MSSINFITDQNRYVCDTHTLVWFLTDDKRLGKKAKSILEQAQSKQTDTQILIPIIILMEILSITEKRKITVNVVDMIESIEFHNNFKIYSINLEVFREMLGISQNLELHDRTIVAIAKLNNAFILTRDQKIKKIYKKIIW